MLVTARRGEVVVGHAHLAEAPRQVEDGPRSLSAPELETPGPGAYGSEVTEPDGRGFAALGEVARPGGGETLFDGSFGATGGSTGTVGPSHEEPDGRARGA